MRVFTVSFTVLATSVPVLCSECTLVFHSEGFARCDLSGYLSARDLPPLRFSHSPNKCSKYKRQEHNGHLQPGQVGVCHLWHHPAASGHVWHRDEPRTSCTAQLLMLQCKSTLQQGEEGDSRRSEELPDKTCTWHLDKSGT